MLTATGRVHGYLDELDWWIREMDVFVNAVRERAPNSAMRFEVTHYKELGTRGWWNKRIVGKYEWRLTYDTHTQRPIIESVLNELTSRLS